jgi:hypothetical protein
MLGDLQVVVRPLMDIYLAATIDEQGFVGRFGFRNEPTFGADGHLLMLCDRSLSPENALEFQGPFFACPDLGSETGRVSTPLGAAARNVLDLEPSGTRYLAVTDGRSAPRPVRWGGSIMVPANEGVVPVAFRPGRLVLGVYDQSEPPLRDQLFVASLDEASPSMREVTGLTGLIVGVRPALGRYLPVLGKTGDDVTLHLIDLEAASVALSMPLPLPRAPNTMPVVVHTDGLIGFELDLDLLGRVTIWVGLRADSSASSDGAAPRPEVIAAYQLRDASDAFRPVAIDLGRVPELGALGAGLHAVRLEIGSTEQPNEAYDPDVSELWGEHNPKVTTRDVHGGALIDIRARRLVWSDLDSLRLVDFTDVDVIQELWANGFDGLERRVGPPQPQPDSAPTAP